MSYDCAALWGPLFSALCLGSLNKAEGERILWHREVKKVKWLHISILLWVVPRTSRRIYILCKDIKKPGAQGAYISGAKAAELGSCQVGSEPSILLTVASFPKLSTRGILSQPFIWTAVPCIGTECRAVKLTSDYWMSMSSSDSHRCFYTLPNVSGVGQLLLFECHCVEVSMLLRTCQQFLSEFKSQRIRMSAVR